VIRLQNVIPVKTGIHKSIVTPIGYLDFCLRRNDIRRSHHEKIYSRKKFAAVLGVGASLSILDSVGYTPNMEQSEQVQFTLRVLYALIPSLCNIIALFIALTYPIVQTMYEEIRKAIATGQKEEPIFDPLHPEQMIG
jgi:hypothetical protein